MKQTVSRWTEKGRVPELNLTSMIDVVFLLLVFFVLTANFNEIEKFLQMNLAGPGTTAPEKVPPPPDEILHIRASDGAGGRTVWTVGDLPCADDDAVAAALASRRQLTAAAVIHPADSTSVEQVLDVYGLCRQTGLQKIQFAAKKEQAADRSENLTDSK